MVGTNTLYIDEDAAEFGVFERVPYPRGAARVIKPEIIYRSTPDGGGRVRRTILPWFTAVAEDGSTLDTVEADSFEDLAVAHAIHEGVKLTLTELLNRFGVIPYRFPAST